MRNEHCRTWNMAKKQKKRGKRETHMIGHEIWEETLKYVEYET
jgi:hypothetical protein